MGAWLSLLLTEVNQANFCYNNGDILGALASQAFIGEMTGAKLHQPLFVQEGSHIDTEDKIKLETAFRKNKIVIGREIRKYVDAYNAQNKNFFTAGKKASNSPLDPEDFSPNVEYLPKEAKA
jgi:hypothetical protein